MNIYDIKQAAEASGVKSHVLRRFIREGILPSRRFAGDRHLLTDADLNAFLVRYRAHEWDSRYKKA